MRVISTVPFHNMCCCLFSFGNPSQASELPKRGRQSRDLFTLHLHVCRLAFLMRGATGSEQCGECSTKGLGVACDIADNSYSFALGTLFDCNRDSSTPGGRNKKATGREASWSPCWCCHGAKTMLEP